MPIRVFKVSDIDWCIGDCSEQEILDFYTKFTGISREEATSDDPDLPRALTGDELDRLKFCDDVSDEKRSFREEMERFIASGQVLPAIFASTET